MRQRDMDRLDRKIARLLGYTIQMDDGWDNWIAMKDGKWKVVPCYTRDLNATVAACDEATGTGDPPFEVYLDGYADHWRAETYYDGNLLGKSYSIRAGSATPALVMSLALLAALEART